MKPSIIYIWFVWDFFFYSLYLNSLQEEEGNKKKVLAEKREENCSFEIYLISFKNHSSWFLVPIFLVLWMWPKSCWHQSWKILPHFYGAEMSKPDSSSPTFHRPLPPWRKPPKRQEQDFLSGFPVPEDPLALVRDRESFPAVFGAGDWALKAARGRKALSCQSLCSLLHHHRMT